MSYTVVEADVRRDEREILHLWERHYPGVMPRKYEWMYRQNPAGPARVWLLKHGEDERTVGMTALFPRIFSVKGQAARGAIAGDLLVDPPHRSLGPALMLQRRVLACVTDGHVDFIYGFPNEASEPVFRRMGYRELGPLVRMVRVLRSAHYLSGFALGGLWGLLAGPVIDAVFTLYTSLAARPARSVVCDELSVPGGDFAALWDTALKTFRVVGDRGPTYLSWKYWGRNLADNRLVAVRNAATGGLLGWSVLRVGPEEVELRDMLLPEEPGAQAALLHALARLARGLGARKMVATFLDNAPLRSALSRCGFSMRPPAGRAFVFPSEVFDAFDQDDWLLLSGDDDM